MRFVVVPEVRSDFSGLDRSEIAAAQKTEMSLLGDRIRNRFSEVQVLSVMRVALQLDIPSEEVAQAIGKEFQCRVSLIVERNLELST